MRMTLRLLALMRPQAGWMALSIALAVLTLAANALLLALSGWFITAMAMAGLAGVSMNYFTPAAIIRAAAMTRTGGRYAERLAGHDATLRFAAALRPRLFAAMERASPSTLQGLASARLLNHLKSDIDQLELAFLRVLSPLVASLVALCLILAGLFVLDTGLGRLAFAGVLLGTLLASLEPARRGNALGRTLPARMDAFNARLLETVEGAAELTIHDGLQQHRQQVLMAGEAILSAEDALHRAGVQGNLLQQMAGGFVLIGFLGLGADLVRTDSLTGPSLALGVFLSLALFEIAGQIPLAIQQVPAVMEAARRVLTILDSPPSARTTTRPFPPLEPGAITLQNVAFTYPQGSASVLRDVTLDMKPGQRIAILGASGAGKSTIGALLMGFIRPDSGEILLEGIPLEAAEPAQAGERIAFLAQDAFLFSASIRENLLIACPQASQKELEEACRQAQILSFVEGLPEGFETFVGAHGKALSGGEARRLTLARTLLRDTPILILDEPTEGLEEGARAAVLDTLLDAHPGRTILLITHHTTRLDRMDLVLRLENGTLKPA